MKFSVNQEDTRKKWLDSENELMRLQNQLSEVRKMNSKLELQYHHATVLLKSEIKVRTQVQEDKKNLVNCLFCLFMIRRNFKRNIVFVKQASVAN